MIRMNVDTALAEVPINLVPLTDDTDFKSIETAVAYNASGLELKWHFTTIGGSYTCTDVTPTTAGSYDWAHQGHGMYTIEIPASGGASINNDTEGFGWFTGVATGVLPWRGPTIQFSPAAVNSPDVVGDEYRRVDVRQFVGGNATASSGRPEVNATHLAGTAYASADFSTTMKASINTEADSALADYDGPTKTEMDSAFSALNDPSAADVADAVWEEAIADHSGTSGSTAEALSAAGSAGDPWTTALPGSYSSGQAGYIIGNNLNATVSSRASQTSVDDLPTNAELATALGTADDAVLSAIASLETHGDLTWATATGFSTFDHTSNQVIVATNNDKTGYTLSATGSAALTEGYAAQGAAGTLPQILYEIRALLAEKSISSTTLTTKKLDGSTTAATYTLDDATTPSSITRAT